MPLDFLNKYPRTKRFLQDTGYTLDQALKYTESEEIKLKQQKEKRT
jgi:hypothetical protein